MKHNSLKYKLKSMPMQYAVIRYPICRHLLCNMPSFAIAYAVIYYAIHRHLLSHMQTLIFHSICTACAHGINRLSTGGFVSENNTIILIAQDYLRRISMDESLIPTMTQAIMPHINPQAVDVVERLISSSPSLSPKAAIEALRKTNIEILIDPSNSDTHSQDHSTTKPNKNSARSDSVYLQGGVEGELILGRKHEIGNVTFPVDDEDDTPSPIANMALYSHMPPKNIDLHPDFILKTGLFRVLPPVKQHPSLDEMQIYELAKPLANGYRYMTLRGQVLNTSMDLQIYLCLAHWFGRMTKEQFDTAIKVPKVLTLDEFFSPLPEEARPSEYYVEESLLDSLARLKSVTMLFYPSLDETDRKRQAMVANLSGTLHLPGNGTIEISPTPELRSVYHSNKLNALNRASVAYLPSQMAKLLGLWLASRTGYTEDWTRINVVITAKQLLMEIHPKERYCHNELRLLEQALNELTQARLVRYSVEFVGSKVLDDTGKPSTLTMASKLTFFGHRFGNKQVFRIGDGTISDCDQNPQFRTKPRGSQVKTEAGKLLADISFASLSGPNVSEEKIQVWRTQFENKLLKTITLLSKAFDESPLAARKMLAGVSSSKVESMQRVLELLGRDDDAGMIREIIRANPRKVEQSELESLIRSIPTRRRNETASAWYKANQLLISTIKSSLAESSNALQELSSIDSRVVHGRLITPLLYAQKTKEAEFFKGLFDAGRQSAEENLITERNLKRRSVD